MTGHLAKEKELIKALIKQAESLAFNDQAAFEKLRKRARMILKNIPAVKEFAFSLLNIELAQPSWTGWGRDEGAKEWKVAVSKINDPLELALEQLETFGDDVDKKTELTNKIFVVHGHDEAMKASVGRVIEKLDFEPIILHERPDKNRTIMQKFTDYCDVGFAIVLLSPDDEGRAIGEESELKLRARQNVVFELGFFIGKLGQNRLLVIHKEQKNFELHSDFAGVLYTPYDRAGRWQYKIVEELQAAGYSVDANKLTKK